MPDLVYRFEFADGRSESFPVASAAADAEAGALPQWTRLEFHQCPNCPLSAATTPHCPMAVRFIELVKVSAKLRSFDPVAVRVDTPQRSITKTTTVQDAVGSLMGLLAATSDCPRIGFLKPMAHFHLPFATHEETLYRVVSMYLLAQYFRRLKHSDTDWDLAALKTYYAELRHVNMAMMQRLRSISVQDGAINALVLLDLLAQVLPYSIDDTLEELRPVFEPE
jgi:uncharacterized protein DUF6901